jgi:hypothetical protein
MKNNHTQRIQQDVDYENDPNRFQEAYRRFAREVSDD